METNKFTPVDVNSRKALDMKSGDTVRVWSKIEEKGKTRLQAFEGVVLARKHGAEPGATFTVRKVSNGVGVERIFPLYSPLIDKIEVLKRSKTRRSKLYFIREKAIKEMRKRMKAFMFSSDTATLEAENQANEPETEEVVENEEATEVETTEEVVEEVPAEEAAPEEKTEEAPTETTEEETKSE